MTITASMVKELREKTGAGMMDAKKALVENNGDFEAAADWLRTKGIAKAEKKSDRIAAEGIVFTAAQGNKGVILEVNSETDFVAKNDKFQAFVQTIAEIALEKNINDVDVLKSSVCPKTGKTVAENLVELVATIGENMNIRRVQTMSVENGVVNGYMHMGGKIGVLVALETSSVSDETSSLARNIAMHVAASNPQFLNRDAIDPAVVEKETQLFREQALESGKPEQIVDKIVAGQVAKFCKEICLVDQPFVMDTDRTVGQVAADANASIQAYVRFGLGEGIEKKEDNFAEEVAAAVAS